MTRGWTTPRDIAAVVRRRWDDGSLLRRYAGAAPFEPIQIRLRGPKPAEIGDDLAAVRDWIAALDAGRRDDGSYGLVWQPVGGRAIGRNEIPLRAIIDRADQVWQLLGVRDAVHRFDEILARAGHRTAVRRWVVAKPHDALRLHEQFARLVGAYDWLDAHRGSGRYLREISAPGVDTKFAEQHRAVLAAILEVSPSPPKFLAELGLRAKPRLVRIRPAPMLGLPRHTTEIALRPVEMRLLEIAPRRALVIENEISYLSVDVPADGVVIWGEGFAVDRVGRLPWLKDAHVRYWGDLDTHGFAMLDQLRAWLPQTTSVLMDRATLVAHRERWGSDTKPTSAALGRLTADELALYTDLVTDALGPRVRLEQERIDWTWVEKLLATE
ncbi:Wadjet anti-phage system protein JetD domain-containing protein [Cumulibacter manganitolerans]|uniref:Wadjet anti-phage system protein JetD domain-containing protein n=1 Tax=Cumulibacter manganitolerans TaxID=1884992 RepID=UPI00129808B1|nr:DUF3322 and DUF2220 domain-containing protein [Cumulibacter manganitolerans]